MNKQLEDLSKPVAWTDAEELRDLSKHSCAYMFIIDPANPYHDPRRQQMLYSQEYVSALLVELEASKKSNTFLKERLSKLANFNPDWDMLEACQESWREVSSALKAAEHRIVELEDIPTIKHMRSVEESLISASDQVIAAEQRITELEAQLQMLREQGFKVKEE